MQTRPLATIPEFLTFFSHFSHMGTDCVDDARRSPAHYALPESKIIMTVAALPAAASSPIEVDASALPLACPGPHAPLWSMHPRVFLDFDATGLARCPYCGAQYQLASGAAAPRH